MPAQPGCPCETGGLRAWYPGRMYTSKKLAICLPFFSEDVIEIRRTIDFVKGCCADGRRKLRMDGFFGCLLLSMKRGKMVIAISSGLFPSFTITIIFFAHLLKNMMLIRKSESKYQHFVFTLLNKLPCEKLNANLH